MKAMSDRQAIPAEIKRQILVGAGHRCAIQTCRSSSDVDIHHIIPWEECKIHGPDNLIALCPNCHRLADRGKIDRKSLRKYKEICQKLVEPPYKHEDVEPKAFIKFNPNTVTEILDTKNISSFTDYGPLDLSFHFEEPFEDATFVVSATGNGSVTFRVVAQTTEFIHIKFKDPCPDIVRLEFKY